MDPSNAWGGIYDALPGRASDDGQDFLFPARHFDSKLSYTGYPEAGMVARPPGDKEVCSRRALAEGYPRGTDSARCVEVGGLPYGGSGGGCANSTSQPLFPGGACAADSAACHSFPSTESGNS